jgi:putative acetyltransferase
MLYDEIEKEALHHSEQLTAEVSKTARPFFEKVGFHDNSGTNS